MSSQARKPVPGSERTPLPGARAVGAPDPNQRIQVTVFVRPRTDTLSTLATELTSPTLPSERQHMTREEFAARYGANPQDLAKVEAFARQYHLDVVQVNAGQRTVILSGRIADLSAAFGVSLQTYEHPDGTYRGRTGAITVPGDLADIVQGVFGLDDRPQVEPHVRRADIPGTVNILEGVAPHAGGTFTSPQLANLYAFPTGVNGAGQTIAIIELGGGFTNNDLQTYFQSLGITPPQVTAVSVNGGTNNPGDPTPNATLEVMLDIEVAGAVAPGARIVCYFAPNTFQDFFSAVNAAISDATNNPSIISISWGASESKWTNQAMNAMDQAFQQAAALGITVCAASADNGSGDGVADGRAHADFPASSSFALGCGGTMLFSSGNTITSEVTWNDGCGVSGGGVSDRFALPNYQIGANIPPSINPGGRIGRGVPDVSGHASLYAIRIPGQNITACGTSAVAPLWAGLAALLNQSLGRRVGFLNPILYANPAVCRDITSGNNGGYAAGAGWDACTGLGSPNAAMLQAVLNPIPTITWADPADIVYGTPLTAAQLNATALLPGTFTYTPPLGTVLNAGLNQTLSVLFTPADPGHQSVTKTVHLNVLKATPIINWSNPPDIIYGTALDSTQLNATASWIVAGALVTVPGLFTYNPPAGTVLGAGPQTLGVTFTPNDTGNYNSALATVQLNVTKATPVLIWAIPSDIDFGTALDSTQLNATASWIVAGNPAAVAGTFTYTPPAGTVLSIGSNQVLSVLFSPTDTSDYNNASASVHINVLTGHPIVVSAIFSPTDIQWNERVEVTIVVKNDSINPHPTQGPDPGFEYSEGDTFQTKGFPSIAGAYRIGVDVQPSPYKVADLYRWGFGHTLAPGEVVTVNGYVRFHNSRENGQYFVAMIQEINTVVQDHQGTTAIVVERP